MCGSIKNEPLGAVVKAVEWKAVKLCDIGKMIVKD